MLNPKRKEPENLGPTLPYEVVQSGLTATKQSEMGVHLRKFGVFAQNPGESKFQEELKREEEEKRVTERVNRKARLAKTIADYLFDKQESLVPEVTIPKLEDLELNLGFIRDRSTGIVYMALDGRTFLRTTQGVIPCKYDSIIRPGLSIAYTSALPFDVTGPNGDPNPKKPRPYETQMQKLIMTEAGSHDKTNPLVYEINSTDLPNDLLAEIENLKLTEQEKHDFWKIAIQHLLLRVDEPAYSYLAGRLQPKLVQ